MAKITISVGGGKGGVGKSIVALNLAVALARLHRRVVLVDADLGGANVHTLLGVERPALALPDFINRKVETLDELVTPTSVDGLSAVFGGDPHLGDANPRHAQKQRLLRHLWRLDADVVVADIGAGTAFNELDLFNAATLPLLVFSPQLPAVKNAYAFAKAALYRQIGQLLPQRLKDTLERQDDAEPTSMDELLARVQAADPDVAERARLLLDSRLLLIVGNMASTAAERALFGGISRLAKEKLGIGAEVLGVLRSSVAIESSVNRRRPFLASAAAGDPDLEIFMAMARQLLRTSGDAAAPAVSVAPQLSTGTAGPRVVLRVDGQTLNAASVLAVDPQSIECSFASPPPRCARAQMLIGPTSHGERIAVGATETSRRLGDRVVRFALVDVDVDSREQLQELGRELAAL